MSNLEKKVMSKILRFEDWVMDNRKKYFPSSLEDHDCHKSPDDSCKCTEISDREMDLGDEQYHEQIDNELSFNNN